MSIEDELKDLDKKIKNAILEKDKESFDLLFNQYLEKLSDLVAKFGWFDDDDFDDEDNA